MGLRRIEQDLDSRSDLANVDGEGVIYLREESNMLWPGACVVVCVYKHCLLIQGLILLGELTQLAVVTFLWERGRARKSTLVLGYF